MQVNPDFNDLLQYLNAAKIRYLVVGAYAVIHHTEPRYTKDLDIWIATDPENAQKTYDVLKKFGAPVEQITPKDLTNPELIYQIGIEPNRIDIIMGLKGLDFEQAWKEKVESTYGNEKVYILGLDHLLHAKETAGRPQDKIDANELRLTQKKERRD